MYLCRWYSKLWLDQPSAQTLPLMTTALSTVPVPPSYHVILTRIFVAMRMKFISKPMTSIGYVKVVLQGNLALLRYQTTQAEIPLVGSVIHLGAVFIRKHLFISSAILGCWASSIITQRPCTRLWISTCLIHWDSENSCGPLSALTVDWCPAP